MSDAQWDEEDTETETEAEARDDPTNRRTVIDLSIDELTRELDGIRERRLVSVRKLEAAAKVKADMAQMNRFVAFNKKKDKIAKLLTTLDERMVAIETELNKLRVLQFEIEA